MILGIAALVGCVGRSAPSLADPIITDLTTDNMRIEVEDWLPKAEVDAQARYGCGLHGRYAIALSKNWNARYPEKKEYLYACVEETK